MNPEIWRDVFDAIEGPAFFHDEKFRVLLANGAYCRAAGMTEAQALDKPYWEVFLPGTGPLPGCKDAVSGKGQTSLQEEVNVGAKLFSSQEEVNVGEKLFLSKGYTVRDDQGKQLYSLHLLSDITVQRQAEQAMADSEKRFRALIESAPDGISLLGVDGKIAYASPATQRILGYPPETVIGTDPRDYTHPDDLDPFLTLLNDLLQKPGGSFTTQYRFRHKDGSWRWLESTVSNLFAESSVNAIVFNYRDITERKLAEEELKRLNRALRTLSACNEALVRAGNEAELLDAICRLIVEVSDYCMAWIGFPEPDVANTVRPVAHYGYDEEYLAAANISWANTAPGRGPTGTAMRTGTVQVNQNFLTKPLLTPWREAAQLRGYQSSIALPLKSAAGTLGVLTIYASEPDAFNKAKVTLLQELADDLAFGIETLRTRAERDRIAYEHLHRAEILRQSLEDSIKAIANAVKCATLTQPAISSALGNWPSPSRANWACRKTRCAASSSPPAFTTWGKSAFRRKFSPSPAN